MNELYHHGTLGMKWGHRRYQNEDGSYKPGAEGRYYTPISRRQQKRNYKELKRYKKDPWGEKYQKAADDIVRKNITYDHIKKIKKAKDEYLKVEDIKGTEWDDSKYHEQLLDHAKKNVDKWYKDNPEEWNKIVKDSEEGKFDPTDHRQYNKMIEYEAFNSDLYDQYKSKYDNSPEGKNAKLADKAWDNYMKECRSVVDDMLGKFSNKKIKDYGSGNMEYGDFVESAVIRYMKNAGNQKISRVNTIR